MTDNTQLIAEARRLRNDYGDVYDVVMVLDDVTDALEAAESRVTEAEARIAELQDLNRRAEDVIRGYLPTVKELETQIAANQNAITSALRCLDSFSWHKNDDVFVASTRRPLIAAVSEEATETGPLRGAAAFVPDGHITVPRPSVPFGPDSVPANIADADYLEAAVRNIDHLGRGERMWGSNVTAAVRKLLLDAAAAVRAL